ncbi:MAG: hypothetical protein ACXQTP_00700, partial [Candidatus Methanofastidiosia archaeon]
MNEKKAIIAIFFASFVLRIMLVYPYSHLLGEDTYFHKDIVDFIIETKTLPQYNLAGWGESH